MAPLIRPHLPNILSLLNALFGSFATYYALRYGALEIAIVCMLIAAVVDFFDGFVARRLQAFSPLGKDIDSLCDVVSFGLAPSAMMCVALEAIEFPLPALAFIILPASVYRLAKFNHDTRQTVSFLGLPTPANALFLAGLAYFTFSNGYAIASAPLSILYKVYGVYPVVIVLLAYLLICDIPMFSLKGSEGISRVGWLSRIALVVVAGVVGFLLWSFTGLAVALGLYILINLWDHFRHQIP